MNEIKDDVKPSLLKRPAQQIVELSDDESSSPAPAIKISGPPSTSSVTQTDKAAQLSEHSVPHLNGTGESDGPPASDASDSDISDSESLIHDIMAAEDEEYGDEDDDTPFEQCTPEESLKYTQRLREVGVERFVQETISAGTITAKKLLTAFGVRPPRFWEGSDDTKYYRLLGVVLVDELLKRKKLAQYNTIEDAAQLLRASENVLVITGAGISTNLGIPDFRSKDTGFYAKMQAKGFHSGEEVFDIHLFREDPTHFYENCSTTFPKAGVTSPTHAFIGLIQSHGKLLTNYTQNIDNIEASAGIEKEKLIQCHGSWATATCQKCGHKVEGQSLLPDVKAGIIPKCQRCVNTLQAEGQSLKRKRRSASRGRRSKSRKSFDDDDDSSDDGRYDIPEPGVMKPDITFFGEALPETFFKRFKDHDVKLADLVIVTGTSMKVAPVSEIPMALPSHVPHIYISRDPCKHINFDITFIGDCDTVIGELARRTGWTLKHEMLPEDQQVSLTSMDDEKAIWAVDRVRKDIEGERSEQTVQPL